ncbi:MAG: hypothetical protein RML72_12010 [Bacteroidia bacterium]|nr:hypothetical protein [Bacteroidia bacterium]MDW8159582.1 hypothetical protein [Bacteroidia bacterium]
MLNPLNQLFPELNFYRKSLIKEKAHSEPSSLLLALDFAKKRLPYLSEKRLVYIKEFFVAPIIFHTLHNFDTIALWSHCIELEKGNQILKPNYLFSCAGSPPNYDTLKFPIFLLIQVSENLDIHAWENTISILCTLQTLQATNNSNNCIYAYLTNGWEWELAQLKEKDITFHSTPYSITQLSTLLASIHTLFGTYANYSPLPSAQRGQNPFWVSIPES